MRSTRAFNLTLFILIFLIVFFMSSILSFRLVLKGERISLPKIIGKTMEEAGAELAKKNILIEVKGEQFHNRFEQGKIISQDPSPGSKIKLNKAVKVILSAGRENVIVPQLKGRSYQSIAQLLKESGLRQGEISQIHTSQYAAGKIIAQFPEASEEVKRNSPISLIVSQGEWEKKYLVPDLIGKHAETVMAKLKELNFSVVDLRYANYPGRDSGIIIKQSPPLGYPIQKNYPITLEVSK